MGLHTNTIKPVDYINIGGVKFNSNEVKEYSKDDKTNSVILNNGVAIKYPDQKAENLSYVESGSKMSDSGVLVTTTDISNLLGGQIEGNADAMDTICLRGAEGTTVDVSKDFLDDQVLIMDSNERASKNNKIGTNFGDTIEFMTDRVDAKVEGPGTTSEASLVYGPAGEPKKSLYERILSWFN